MFLSVEAVLLVVFVFCFVAERRLGLIVDFGSGASEIAVALTFTAMWLFLLIGSPFFFRSLRWVAWVGWLIAVSLFVWAFLRRSHEAPFMDYVMFIFLGLAALIVLTWSAIFSRTMLAVILWGLVTIGLMVLQTMLLTYLAGISSATSGSQDGYKIRSIALAVFGASLPLYFGVAFGRILRRGDW